MKHIWAILTTGWRWRNTSWMRVGTYRDGTYYEYSVLLPMLPKADAVFYEMLRD